MRATPGFLSSLQEQLETLPCDILERLTRFGGLEPSDIIQKILKPIDFTVHDPEFINSNSIDNKFHEDLALRKLVLDLFSKKQIGICIDASKLSNEDIEENLSMLLFEAIGNCPVWILTSLDNKSKCQQFINHHKMNFFLLDSYETLIFRPDNSIDSFDNLKICGSGDAVACLLERDFLINFVDSGGRYVVFLDASKTQDQPDVIQMLCRHVKSNFPSTFHVKESVENKEEPCLVRHEGINQLVSPFRISFSDPFDGTQSRLIWTGFAVLNSDLDFTNIKWKWHRRSNRINQRITYSFQRYFEDLSETFKTNYVL